MADACATEKEVAKSVESKSVEEQTKTSAEDQEETNFSSGSDADLSEDEEIVLDEASDTENYVLPETKQDESEDDESSGDEEGGVRVQEVTTGETKFLKLKFDDVEAKRKEFLLQINSSQSDDDNAGEDKENKDATTEDESQKQETKESFSNYRTVMDEDMAEYASSEDDDFNPVYCGETLSDVEYEEGDERDTESEPEVEDQGQIHKKTGEALKCIRMIQQLQIPPECSAIDSPHSDANQSPMECA